MFDIFAALLAAGLNGSAPSSSDTATALGPLAGTTAAGAGTVATGFDMSVVPQGLVPEDQTPSGKFLTAGEIKPILNATKGNWIAVRAYEGQDLLYVTHLWAWRCGLKALALSVNGAALQDWPLPACHEDLATPNAVLPEDGLPYMALGLNTVETIKVQIVYDDLTMDMAEFARGDVLIP